MWYNNNKEVHLTLQLASRNQRCIDLLLILGAKGGMLVLLYLDPNTTRSIIGFEFHVENNYISTVRAH